MDLNLDALANAIIEEYKQHTGDKKLVENFISSVGESGTYSDVYKLAKKAGLNLEQAIINQWTFEADEVYFGTMKELLKKTTGPMHDDIAKACHFIQDNMNKATGVKLKSQLAPLNEYDLGDIAERMKNQGITKLSGELQTLGCKMVDDNQQANMELQTSVGFEIVVSRKYDSIGLRSGTKYAERCKICVGLEGTHQFKYTREARSSGVFARHPGCGCVIDYYSKRTGTVTRGVQNYNTAQNIKDIKLNRNEEVINNLNLVNETKRKQLYLTEKGNKIEDVTLEYISNATPYKNLINVQNADIAENVETAKWIDRKLGWEGELLSPIFVNGNQIKTPDAYIKGQYWEFKNCIGKNSIDERIRAGSKQINNILNYNGITDNKKRKGTILLDITTFELDHASAPRMVLDVIPKRCKTNTDVIIRDKERLVVVYRYTKKQ